MYESGAAKSSLKWVACSLLILWLLLVTSMLKSMKRGSRGRWSLRTWLVTHLRFSHVLQSDQRFSGIHMLRKFLAGSRFFCIEAIGFLEKWVYCASHTKQSNLCKYVSNLPVDVHHVHCAADQRSAMQLANAGNLMNVSEWNIFYREICVLFLQLLQRDINFSIAFFKLEKERSHTASEQIGAIKYVLNRLGKCSNHPLPLISQNGNVNGFFTKQ